MIVPRTRLLFLVGFLVLPLSILSAVDTSALIAIGVLLLVVLVDAMMVCSRLDGIRAEFPEVVRLTRYREGELSIDIENDRMARIQLRLGVAFPAEIELSGTDLFTTLPEDTQRSHVVWPCTGRERGNFVLENIYLEAASHLGLWSFRRTSVSRSEVRVYPNIMSEKRNMAAIFTNRGLMGMHAQRQVGKGREFERLREYIPGDSYEDIHWKATAKRGYPIAKIFQIERTQEVYVVLDSSRLSAREVEENMTQLERFVTSALVMGLVAEKQSDLFGVLAFDDQVRTFVRARNGREHYNVCRDSLYALQPKMVNPDFGELCSFIRLRMRRRALLIFLTNLDDPVLAESFVKNMDLIGSHHLVIVNMLTKPGVAEMFSGPDVETTDDLYKSLGGHIQWQKLQELVRVLKRRGIAMSLLDNERMCPELVSQYINVKRRQLL